MRNYRQLKEAKSAYLQAAKIDDGNLTVLRDLSSVQLTLGDWEGLAETRRKTMIVQPAIVNWASYLWALAKAESWERAFQCWDALFELLQKEERQLPFQQSEMHLYLAHLYAKSGNVKKGIKLLEKR